jgi:Fe2+ transport system protein B
MKKKSLIGIYIISVIVAIVIGLILSTVMIYVIEGSEFPIPIPPQYLPALKVVLTIKTVISFVNVALIFLMLGIYIDLYRKIKTNFTAGLLLLIIVLLLNSLTANPILFLRMEGAFIVPGMGFILPELFTTIALTVLFYLSLE